MGDSGQLTLFSDTLPEPTYEGPVDLSLILGVEPIDPPKRFVDTFRFVAIQQPVILIQYGEFYRVADGRRRCNAARVLGYKTVPARVYPEEMAGEIEAAMTLMLNAARSSNPVVEFEAIELLLERGYSEKEIARRTGMTVQTVRQRMRLTHLIPFLMELFSSGKVKVGTATAAAKLPASLQLALEEKYREAGSLTYRDVRLVKHIRVEESAAQHRPLFDQPVDDMPLPEVRVAYHDATQIVRAIDGAMEAGDIEQMMDVLSIVKDILNTKETH
jgi:hypothetical protein